ncbi:MAG: 3-methyladenine DNA glycosylase [Microbacteriaceae bacterium]|nr:3-methyladenine DNA glycosylase [Microbacteriaceae bacterium]
MENITQTLPPNAHASKNATVTPPPYLEKLTKTDWQERETAHKERTHALTAAHTARRARGEKHAIEDFLFTYYSYKPAQIARWHPGAGMLLSGCTDRADWRYYAQDSAGAWVDLPGYFAQREGTVAYVENLLRQTLDRPARFGCFGLHEWAMVFHLTPEQIRHRGLRLRLGSEASDKVVAEHTIGCSHFDAFRFFTPDAAPLNTIHPTRATQPDLEQAGCLHAGMDLYKWATKLGPIVPGELLLDCFELARDIRTVDMQASPYDVSDFGLPAIEIENAAGKREYVALQRGFATRGNALRERLLETMSLARKLSTLYTN